MTMPIRTSDSLDKLLPALHAARQEIRPTGKSGENTYDHYKYANEADWHQAVMPALLKNSLVLVFSSEESLNLPDRKTKAGGTEYAVQLKVMARLYHTSGQWIEIDGYGQGQDRADKAGYKAATGAKKYAYSMLFSLPTSDDPERDETVGRSRGAPPQPRPAKTPRKPPNELILGAETYEDLLMVEKQLRARAGEFDEAERGRLRGLCGDRRFLLTMKAVEAATKPDELIAFEKVVAGYPHYKAHQREQLVTQIRGMEQEMATR